jgi:hypothetical protein
MLRWINRKVLGSPKTIFFQIPQLEHTSHDRHVSQSSGRRGNFSVGAICTIDSG